MVFSLPKGSFKDLCKKSGTFCFHFEFSCWLKLSQTCQLWICVMMDCCAPLLCLLDQAGCSVGWEQLLQPGHQSLAPDTISAISLYLRVSATQLLLLQYRGSDNSSLPSDALTWTQTTARWDQSHRYKVMPCLL